jgi:2-dehydro-3-deoxyphosphogluconate aldolase / (4S)-4-hydroxy-2-oxoglutarate aldolase
MSRSEITAHILARRIVAVLRLNDGSQLLSVAQALRDGGITIVEVTLTTPGALEGIARTCSALPDVLVGAGSVLGADTAVAAMDAGAKFIVSPVCKAEILACARERDVCVVPGAFSPTEILAAHEAGADIVKVFPADVLGIDYFRAILAPMPGLRLMPTGGVTVENAGQWLKAGACAVGIGSALLRQKLVDAGDWAGISAAARAMLAAISPEQSPHIG